MFASGDRQLRMHSCVCNVIYIVYRSLALNLICRFVTWSLDLELFLPTIRGAWSLPPWLTDNWKCYLCPHHTFFHGDGVYVKQHGSLWHCLITALYEQTSHIAYGHFLTDSYPREGSPSLSRGSLVFQKWGVFEDIVLSLCSFSTQDLCSEWVFYPSGAVSLINLWFSDLQSWLFLKV